MSNVMSDEPNGKTSIGEQRLEDLLAAISADALAPGAGAAGSVALALAAACARKAATISLKHHPENDVLQAAIECFADITRRALSGADADADAFVVFMRAPSAGSVRQLIDTDEKLADLSGALISLVSGIEPHVDEELRGDLVAARALATASRRIQARNVAETRQQGLAMAAPSRTTE